MQNNQVKISSFYGAAAPRPYMVFDVEGRSVQNRVDFQSANAPLLSWASKVPFEAGGSLNKQEESLKAKLEALPKPRNEFLIFLHDCRAEIKAANPMLDADKDLKVAAGFYWKEKLTDAERQAFKDKAAAERTACVEASKALLAQEPELQKFMDKEAAYKKSKVAINSAHRMSIGPLHRAARAMKLAADKKNTATDKKSKRKGGSRVKVPDALKLVFKKRPTKKYEIRSNEYAAKRAAAAAAAAVVADSDSSSDSDSDFDSSSSDEDDDEEFAVDGVNEEVEEEEEEVVVGEVVETQKKKKITTTRGKNTSKNVTKKTTATATKNRKRKADAAVGVSAAAKESEGDSENDDEYSGEFALPMETQQEQQQQQKKGSSRVTRGRSASMAAPAPPAQKTTRSNRRK